MKKLLRYHFTGLHYSFFITFLSVPIVRFHKIFHFCIKRTGMVIVIQHMRFHLLQLLLLLLFFSCNSAKRTFQTEKVSETPTLLLVGTSHDLRDTPVEAIQAVKEKIITFDPQVFFVELPPADDKYANELVFSYSQNFALFQHLLNKKNIQIRMADSVILSNQVLLSEDPYNPLCLANLLHANLLKFDIANTLYQSYQLFGTYRQNDSVMAIVDDKLFSIDTLDMYQLIVTGEEKDEFSQIIFPTAQALHLPRIYGFDNRDDEYAYDKALRANDRELRSYIQDQWKVKQEEAIKNKMDSVLGVPERRIQDQSNVFEFLNSIQYDRNREMEYQQRLTLTPSESSHNSLKYWTLRSRKMSNNIAEVLEKTQAKRGVIVVGAIHTWSLRQMLEEKGYQVVRLFEEQ